MNPLQTVIPGDLKTLLEKSYATSKDQVVDLTGFDLCGLNLNGFVFRNVVFSERKPDRHRTIEHTDFRNCTFLNCSFAGATLANAAFRASRFEHCDFRLAVFRNNTFTEATLERCDFYRSVFEGNNVFEAAQLRYCSLHLVARSGADLRRDNLTHAVVQEFKTEYEVFLSSFGVLTSAEIKRYSALRYREAAGIYRALSGFWAGKGCFGDATWAYVRSRRLESKLKRPPYSWYAPVLRGGGQSHPPGKAARAIGMIRPFLEYLVSLGVDLVCGYGSSLIRVFLTIAFTVLAFAMIYQVTSALTVGNAASLHPAAFADCANFSLHRLIAAAPPGIQILDRFEPFAAGETVIGVVLIGLFGFVFGNYVRNS